ncbi:MAG: hypothetical protein WCZ00_02135 [Acholeplasmataceae bacterium]
MPSFLMIQWGIIGFFVLIHFIIGFLRGTSKSTYFTIVSLIMTVVTLWIVSLLSINMILSSSSMLESLIGFVNGLTGGAIPDEVITALAEPEVLALIVAIGDLVLRIIAFIILYPMIKFFLTLIIFKPIWKHAVLPKILKRQNENEAIKYHEKHGDTRRFVPKKRLNKNILSRLFGGAMGSFRGLVVAFIFLVPLLVIAGFASEINSSINLDQTNEVQNLSTTQDVALPIPSEVQEILNNIEEMNNNGLGAIVKDIKIQEKSLDRYIFDEVFTVKVKTDEVETSINYGNELEHIMGIAQIVIEGGYLEDGFKIENISSTDADNLESVFNHIGQSDLLAFMIPAAVRYGVNNLESLAPEYFQNMDINQRTASLQALDNFYDILWDEEFNRMFDVADAALTFATVGEWMTYMDQPELLAELTPEEGVLLANIVRAFGDLEVLTLLNVAIDYATTLDEVQQEIAWLAPEDVEPYLQDRFAFILDDPDFFIGDEGEISRIAQIIETVFSDEFGDQNLSTLINSFGDPEALINNQNPEWVGSILEDLVEVKLIVESLPVGVDYAFYAQLKDSMTEELADQIAAELEQISWEDEIINVGDIYKEALKLGVGAIFGENPDYYTFIDDVAVNHMDSLRQIVEYVFEGSQVVNTALEIASPTIVETMVTDIELQEVIKNILISDDTSGVVDFNFGQEINNLLTIVESVYEFSTFTELNSLSGLETDQQIELISQFSSLDATQYATLRTAINDLQVLTRADERALNFIQSKVTSPYIFIPDSIALNQEVVSVIDLAYEVSKYLDEQAPLYMYNQDIDLTGLFEDPDFRAFFMNSTENLHSNLLLINVANNVKNIIETGALSAYTTLPDAFLTADIDSELWKDEASQMMEAIFDLVIAAGQTEALELSYVGIMGVVGDTSKIPLDTFYQMSENETFLELFDSNIIHKIISDALSNPESQQVIVNAVNQAQTIFVAPSDFFVADPALMDGDLIKPEEFENIIIAAHTLGFTDIASFSTLGIETFTSLLDRNIDSETGEDDFDRVFGANYIYAILDKVLKQESLGDFVGSTLGSALGITVEDFDTTPSTAMLASDTNVYEPVEIGKVPKEEFRRMITSLSLMGDIGTIGLNTFTDMIDPSLPTDEFDTFISSDYIYTILARLFANDAFGNYVGDALAGAFSDDPISLEMAVPSDAQGTTGVEEDLITRSEIKKMMTSLDMLDIGGDVPISVETILDMIDFNVDSETGEDDFSRFIDSLYIQDKVSQLLLSEQVINMIANERFLATDLVMPASSVIEVDGRERMIKQEIYDLFAGLKLIGIGDLEEDPVTLETITSLTDQEEDDLLASSYLYVTLDLMLKSEASINVPDDALEVSGDYEGLIQKSEIKDLLAVFDIVGEDNPEDIDVNLVTIADIQAMLDLESNMIDQMVSDAIEENILNDHGTSNVPLTAKNTEGTRILRDELNKMVETLLILSDNDDQRTLTSLMPIDTATLNNATLTAIHNVDSRIIDRLTSDAIIDSGISIHSLAYDENSELDAFDSHKLDIKRGELGDMLAALDILDIDINNAGTIDQTKYTPSNIGLLLDLESHIIYRLISENIINQSLHTDESLAVNGDDNYDPEAIGSDIKVIEMEALVEAMTVLGIIDLSQTISVDTVSIAQLKETHYLGLGIDPDVDVYQSRIIHRLISDAVVDSLYTGDPLQAPDNVFMTVDNKDLKPAEITALIESLDVMGLATLGDPITVDTLTITQLKGIHYLGLGTDPVFDEHESLIIHRLISDAVVDSLYNGDPLQAPDDVFMTLDNEDLKPAEITALIESLDVMGLTKLSDPIDVDNLTLQQLEDIHYLGLGTDPVFDEHESLIIHRLISDSVITTVDVPDDAYMNLSQEDVKPLEISALIEALDTMGLTKLSDPIDVNALTLTTLKEIHYLGLGTDPVLDEHESLIIHRMVSDSVVDSLYAGDPLNAPSGVFKTIDNEDLEEDEISALIEAMDEMNITSLGASLSITNPNVTQLQNLHYLGLAEDPNGDTYESLIVHRLISDSISSVLSVPNDAYDSPSNDDLKVDEISALIEAMNVMSMASLSAGFAFTNPTTSQIQELNYLGLGVNPSVDLYDSYTVHRLLSDAIDSVITVPVDSYIVGRPDDIKAEEIDHLVGTLDILGMSDITEFSNITVANLSGLSAASIEFITEETSGGPNLIVYYFIDDIVDPNETVGMIDANYVMDGPTRVRLTRAALADALEAL